MPFLRRIFILLCLALLLICQACSHLRTDDAPRTAVHEYEFQFIDGGKAGYFVLDKYGANPGTNPGAATYPDTYLFVIPGSDCASMGRVLPRYFQGLEGTAGTIRIFILQKRFITARTAEPCSDDFIRADHPRQWIADQSEFLRTELDAARVNGQTPRRIVVAGISEGAEIAPALAHRFPEITHVTLLGNGGMDPFESYRLQAEKHGLQHGLDDIAQRCAGASEADGADAIVRAGERTCRYWKELQAIRHTDNLLALDVPIFIAMGETDTMVPIESAWFVRDAFAVRGKTNLQLLSLPDTGHDFRRNGVSMLPYVWDALEQWIKK